LTLGIHRALSCGLALVLSLSSCSPAAVPCTTSGGERGSVMQLRRISFGDDQISLLFALRPGAAYGVPEHVVTTSAGRIRVHVPGGRLRHHDGTASYFGELEPAPPPGRIRSVRIAEEADGSVLMEIDVEGAPCPRISARRYGLGTTFSAALVSIALRDGPVVALDPDRAAPAGSVQVVGLGFAASSHVTFDVRQRTVWSSRTDELGHLDTVLFVPDAPGRGAALVRDESGSTALAWFLVDEQFRR
jgi:hypothetical protein